MRDSRAFPDPAAGGGRHFCPGIKQYAYVDQCKCVNQYEYAREYRFRSCSIITAQDIQALIHEQLLR
ncbi:MAG TPA: hypothetical protein DHV42_08460 [Lachnospiraceae bacterium]|nr:hypothetical protein [Lachnospiraceae bacterium]